MAAIAKDDIILPDSYGEVKLGDSFEKVNSSYNLIKISLKGPFKSDLYVLMLEDPSVKEVDFEFYENKLIWFGIRYKATTGVWNNQQSTGYGTYTFEMMEEKLIEEYGKPDDKEKGEEKYGGITTSIWKRWIWKNEQTVMEFEGKCNFYSGMQGDYAYTQGFYPREFEEKLEEIREEKED